MTILLVLIVVLALAILLVRTDQKRGTIEVERSEGFRVSFNRPALRTDLHCWLVNASFVNGTASAIIVRNLWFDTRSEENAFRGSDDERIPEAQRTRLNEQVHHLLALPLELEAGRATIGIVAFPATYPDQFEHPELHVAIVDTSEGEMRFPLWRKK